MKKIGFMIGVMLLSAHVLFASSVALKGTVKNGAGAGIAGVKVSLVKLKTLSTTTDAQGAFTLTGTKAFQVLSLEKPQFKFSLVGSDLVISPAFENIAGCVDIFSSDGRKNASIPFRGNRAGKQIVNLPEFGSGMSIIRVTIGNEIITRTLVCMGNSNRYLKNDVANIPATDNFSLAKQMAGTSVDTLVATKTGYSEKKTAIASYSMQDIAVTLDTLTTGTCPALTLPAASAITYNNAKMPDPFTFKFMSLPRVTTKAQWECRRQEISAMAQQYLYGHLPPKPESVTGTVNGGTIKIDCKQGSKTASFTVNASGSGSILVVEFGAGAPKPANSRTCSISATSMISTMKTLYGSTDVGICMAAAWGVARLIDVLELNPTGGIDATKVVTTGCSTNGKLAAIAGIFEPRVAICMPVESGCAGTCAWRVSSEYGHGDSNKDCQDITHLETNWLGTVASPWQGGNPKIAKLPLDQHEIMALRAPGAMMAYNNFHDWMWLCSKGNVAAAQGCHWIYKALGVSDNFGFAEPSATHTHCSFPSSLNSTATAFYDKFLNGKADANTKVLQWYSGSQETEKWFDWDTSVVLQ